MNLSMKWLNDYVDIDVEPREFSEKMTMSGSKVEGYEVVAGNTQNIVIGKILSVEKHPEADKLVICMVDTGDGEPTQIVTGASNVFAGAVIPVAKNNSILPNGTKIKKGKLRGVESNGMLCSLSELGLGKGDFPYAIEDGIFIIEEDVKIGENAIDALGIKDTVVEFEITSNRPDCLSVKGLAREAALTFGKEFKNKKPVVKGNNDDINNYLSVEIKNPTLCTRYTAKVVKNVKIEPSPRWLRERLRSSGVRPINNIVDITNFVMLEYGYPMHSFDYDYVNDKKIIVRNAEKGEKITTLDGTERELSDDMLVIADAKGAVAVAGVMGGEHSGINDNTKTIVFEGACFDGASVRITSKKLGLRSESSSRFEKGLTPAICLEANERACELVELLGAGEVVGGTIDIYPNEHQCSKIKLDEKWINNFLDIDLTRQQMVDILKGLEFGYDGENVIAPPFRTDIAHKADIAEEIARFYGYDVIPVTAIRGTAQGKLTMEQKFENMLSQVVLAQGISEVMTYSFISPKYYDKINMPADSQLRKSVVITNPLGEDTSIMRTTAIPSMLEVLSRNYNNRNENCSFYEFATEYIPTTTDKLPIEKKILTIGMYGNNKDFYTLKGVVETILERVGVSDYDVDAVSDEAAFHPGRCAKVSEGGKYIGILGEVHPYVVENYEIDCKCYVASIDIEALFALWDTEKQYKQLPKYPATTRDIALLCDESLPVLAIEKAIRTAAGKILEKVALFDVYQGSQIESGKKSVAYNLTLRAS
ncbi:MAG: phenylalanine--tRNA ligase subunit beta, partial [Oscillospiraceae bacterium]